MLLLNKLYSYNESVLSKLPLILTVLKKQPMSVLELYSKVIPKLSGVSEFIDTLDCLYALGKIDYDGKEDELHYVV